MFAAAVAVSVVLAAMLAFSAMQKLGGSPAVVESYRVVGVDPERLTILAITLLAGAAGVLAGLVWAPLGVTASACLVAYFMAAIGAHIRHHAMGNVATPIIVFALASAALVLRTITM